MKVLDHGFVRLVESWGSDERIVEAARMSTQKGFEGWGPDADGKPGDEKLLGYLYRNNHATPFELAGAIVEVQAPIFVFREWHRHRTQSYNEMSARYAPLPEQFYVPSLERMQRGAQSSTNKQSSGMWPKSIPLDKVAEYSFAIASASRQSFETYRKLLAEGVSRELARIVLPVNTYSRMRASANLRNWLGFLTLRMAPQAQWEIRQYAEAVHALLAPIFPRTMALFDEKAGAQ